MKKGVLTIVFFFLLFSMDGVDISTLVSLCIFPFINYRKLLAHSKSIIIFIYLLFFISSSLSITLNFYTSVLSQVIRFSGLLSFTFLLISEADYVFSNLKRILRIMIFGAVFFDLIALYFVFILGTFQLEGFKPFYPSFRYQGFYNLTVNAITHSILLFYLISFNLFSKKMNLIFGFVLFTIILLSLTRTSWLLFLVAFFCYSIIDFNFLKKVLTYSFFSIIVFFTLENILMNSNFGDSFFSDLIINRIFSDTYNSSDDLEKNRGNFYYPIELVSRMEINFFGNGLGASEHFGGKIFHVENENLGEADKLGTHNTFAHILLDYGLIPFLFFIILIITLLFMNLYSVMSTKKNILKINLSILLGLLFAMMYQDLDIYLPVMSVLTLIIIIIDKCAVKLLLS